MTSIRVLIVDPSTLRADVLAEQLGALVEIDDIEIVPSFSKALGMYLDAPFKLCLVSDKIAEKELEGFIRDAAKINPMEPCVFIQIRESIQNGNEREVLREIGVKTIITRDFDQYDKDYVLHALGRSSRDVEIRERSEEIEQVMGPLLDQLDKISRERRRGRQGRLNLIFGEMMKMHTAFDESLLDRYFDVLLEAAEESVPEEAVEIEMPDSALALNLPGLQRNTYTGPSARVWKRLLKRWGKRIHSAADDSKSKI